MNQREAFESNFPRPKDVMVVDGQYKLVCDVITPEAMMDFMEFCARWQGWEAATEAKGDPAAWIRFTSAGGFEGPLADCQIDDFRKNSGVWTALYPSSKPLND